jgi:hypothetical protein
MLIVTTYETPDTVRDMLSEYEINVQKHESNGSLVIMTQFKDIRGPIFMVC